MTRVGDLITRDGQYEFRRAGGDHSLLFNGDSMPQIKMLNLEGLFGMPEIRRNDVEKQANDGWLAGTAFLGARILTGDFALLADSQYDMMQAIMDMGEALQVDNQDGVLVFQRARVGKRMIYCRPDKFAIPSKSDVAAGIAKGSLQWVAHDPRIYSFHQQVAQVTVPAGATSGQVSVFMGGNWARGVPALVEVNGPGTQIRIANAQDFNRQLRLTGTLASNETYVLDTGRLTVTDVGTGQSRIQRLARDNQWWQLRKGENVITVNRTDTSGTMIIKIYWRDGYVL